MDAEDIADEVMELHGFNTPWFTAGDVVRDALIDAAVAAGASRKSEKGSK